VLKSEIKIEEMIDGTKIGVMIGDIKTDVLGQGLGAKRGGVTMIKTEIGNDLGHVPLVVRGVIATKIDERESTVIGRNLEKEITRGLVHLQGVDPSLHTRTDIHAGAEVEASVLGGGATVAEIAVLHTHLPHLCHKLSPVLQVLNNTQHSKN